MMTAWIVVYLVEVGEVWDTSSPIADHTYIFDDSYVVICDTLWARCLIVTSAAIAQQSTLGLPVHSAQSMIVLMMLEMILLRLGFLHASFLSAISISVDYIVRGGIFLVLLYLRSRDGLSRDTLCCVIGWCSLLSMSIAAQVMVLLSAIAFLLAFPTPMCCHICVLIASALISNSILGEILVLVIEMVVILWRWKGLEALLLLRVLLVRPLRAKMACWGLALVQIDRGVH